MQIKRKKEKQKEGVRERTNIYTVYGALALLLQIVECTTILDSLVSFIVVVINDMQYIIIEGSYKRISLVPAQLVPQVVALCLFHVKPSQGANLWQRLGVYPFMEGTHNDTNNEKWYWSLLYLYPWCIID